MDANCCRNQAPENHPKNRYTLSYMLNTFPMADVQWGVIAYYSPGECTATGQGTKEA